jgi:hypothetical protein
MIRLDNDLEEILSHAATTVASEAWAVKTIIHLVMSLQQSRQTIRVLNKLNPEVQGEAGETRDRSNDAVIRPHQYAAAFQYAKEQANIAAGGVHVVDASDWFNNEDKR